VSGFVHLHVHTTWSLLDGAIPAEMLPFLARALGYEAIAITDHDALTGAVRFTKACEQAGVKPLYGAELTLDDGSHLTVLAKNRSGYGNLCRLISEAHLSHERGQPSISRERIVERADGLFVLSGCERGEVARLAAAGSIPEAIAAARRWRSELGDAFRLEVFDHRGYGHRGLRDRLLKIAHETGVRPVATNDVHYPLPDHAVTHEVLHAIKEIVPLSCTQALRPNAEYHLKAPEEMRALFADAPEAANETLRIAEACDFELDLGSYHFPAFGISGSPARLLRERCYQGAGARFGSISSAVEDRLEHELDMIVRKASRWTDGNNGHSGNGFASFFLLVADIVEHAKHKLGIRCACRGSAAGSLVCYVLDISDVDPVRYDLLFERFMNEKREELPDIDVDVESHRREEVLAHILDTYGAEQTAMCCMVDTFRARMAIRDVGKAMGLPPEEIDLVAKAFPRIRAKHIPQAMASLPELRGSNLVGEQIEQLFELCYGIDGFPRHLALHPSGVILSSSDLADRVPMQESFGGFTMLQADKHDVEDLGLVKLDVLGVRMLSSIAHARGEIARVRGAAPNLDALTHDDPGAFELMRSARTVGCFQIESPGQRDLLPRLQPQRFEDLIVEISLFRPGPVKSDMVKPYLQRRHGFEEPVYLHPILRPLLAETNGVIVYHEQLIRAISAVTGCSLAEADFVRRHLDSERETLTDAPSDTSRYMDRRLGDDTSVARWFQDAAVGNGFTPEQAATLWKEVFAFASFGFCKSHAAAFALPTYLSAWLKAHYPAEFYAGLLTHDPGMYPRRLIVADARRFGIPILPIDVNHSDKVYRVEPVDPLRAHVSESARTHRFPAQSGAQRSGEPGGNDAPVARGDASSRVESGDRLGVRLALSEVRDISEAEVDSLLATRYENGPFTSLEDVWRRAGPSRPVLENLVHMGALDSIAGGRSRRELLWRAVDISGRLSNGAISKRADDQLQLDVDASVMESLPGLSPYDEREKTEAELEIGGIDARRHVMDHYERLLAELGCVSALDLKEMRNDSTVWVAGVKVASQTPAIRSGQRIIFITLDDTTGPIDVTVFERAQPRAARTVFHSWVLLVKGTLRKRGGASRVHRTAPGDVGTTVVAEEVFDLAELAADRAAGHSPAAALGRQRRRQAAAAAGTQQPGSGLRQGEQPKSRLWHASGGSAGR
jgi:error-prone DNA polymerase